MSKGNCFNHPTGPQGPIPLLFLPESPRVLTHSLPKSCGIHAGFPSLGFRERERERERENTKTPSNRTAQK